MEEFLKNLQSPGWLLSVVLTSVGVNVVAHYLIKWLDNRVVARVSSRLRQKLQKEELERKNLIAQLESDTHGQLITMLFGLYNSLLAALFLVSATIFFVAINFLVITLSKSTFFLFCSFFFLFGAILCCFVSFRLFLKSNGMMADVSEATHSQPSKQEALDTKPSQAAE